MKKTKMLKKNYEFRKVLKNGNYFSGKFIEAFVLKNKNNENFLGIAISVKIAKAVRRNKIKRLIREGYKNFEMQTIDGYSIIFLWKRTRNIENATYENILKDMFEIFKKSQLLKDEA